MIPIFCIHLERATERKVLIQDLWVNKLGLDITFWPAYDRRLVEKDQMIYPYNRTKALSIMERELNDGEIACATSFCLLYEHIMQNNIVECIILEDDVIPLVYDKETIFSTIGKGKEEFPEVQMMILHKPAEIDLVNHPTSIFYHKKTHSSLCRVTPWGNLCFYVTIDAVRYAWQLLRQMCCVADYPQRELAMANKVIIANNPICEHYESEQTKTYIGNYYRKSNRIFMP